MTSLSRRVRKQPSGVSTASSQESLSGSFISCSLQSSQLRNSYKHILLTITLLALGVIYFVFDPSASRIFPKCPVMSLTGLPCAGCGSQRAIHALLHLDFAEAIRYNFLVVAILPFLGLLIFSSFFRKRFPKLYLVTHHAYVAYGILAIIMLWWVLRIIFGWYV